MAILYCFLNQEVSRRSLRYTNTVLYITTKQSIQSTVPNVHSAILFLLFLSGGILVHSDLVISSIDIFCSLSVFIQ